MYKIILVCMEITQEAIRLRNKKVQVSVVVLSLIKKNGEIDILTNYHVIEGATTLTCTLADNTNVEATAKTHHLHLHLLLWLQHLYYPLMYK